MDDVLDLGWPFDPAEFPKLFPVNYGLKVFNTSPTLRVIETIDKADRELFRRAAAGEFTRTESVTETVTMGGRRAGKTWAAEKMFAEFEDRLEQFVVDRTEATAAVERQRELEPLESIPGYGSF